MSGWPEMTLYRYPANEKLSASWPRTEAVQHADAYGNPMESSQYFPDAYVGRLEAELDTLREAVTGEVERLRKVEKDCTREVERRRDKGLERNVLAEGRVMTAGAAADNLEAILTNSREAGRDR